jgi:lactate dehydrogenase-like 2-hydroxyacid dehydrogenase
MPRVRITQEFIAEALDEFEGTDITVEQRDSPEPLDYDALVADLDGYDAAICLLTDRIDKALLDSNPSLRAVANVAVGFDNINIPAATERGIVVLNTPDVLTDATADLAFTLILSVARRVTEGDAFLRSGHYRYWRLKQEQLGLDVYGQTLGIFGLGKIGRAVAGRARGGFNMTVLYHDPFRLSPEQERELGVEYVEFDDLLARSDFLSLHAPLTEQTRHAVDAVAFDKMPDHAVLINTSRGPLVDEAALVEALRVGRIAGAGLDVFEFEPDVVEGLTELRERVVLLPHLGSATERTRLRMARLAAGGIRDVLQGRRPSNVVNPEVFDRQDVR